MVQNIQPKVLYFANQFKHQYLFEEALKGSFVNQEHRQSCLKNDKQSDQPFRLLRKMMISRFKVKSINQMLSSKILIVCILNQFMLARLKQRTIFQEFFQMQLMYSSLLRGKYYQNHHYIQYQMEEKQYPQQKYRFVILITYLTAALVNSIPVHTFSSINVAVQRIFEISSLQVTLNALLFTIAHPLFAFPCNWLINKHGMRTSFIVGGAFLIVGVWLRLLLDKGNSIFCLIGSTLAAIGNIFILNTPSKMAINWFKTQKVNTVAFTGILFNLLSITIGAAIPGFIIDDQTGTVEQVKQLLFYQAIIVTIPYIFLGIFFREKPQCPPSKEGSFLQKKQPEKYNQLLKNLFKNKEYLKLMAAMSLNYGTLTATIVVLDQAVKGLGYRNSSEITSNTILSAMLIGILGNPIFSFLLNKTNAYRAVSGLNTFGGFYMFTVLIFAYVYQVTSSTYIIIISGLVGIFLIPLPSIMIMYGSQLVFPIDEGSSAGYLLAASQTFGFAVGIIAISFLDRTVQRSQIVLFTFCGLLFLSFLISIFVKEDLKKLRYALAGKGTEHQTQITNSLIKYQEASDK